MNKKRYIVNFPGHLANCEFNYRRLRRLMPGWPISPSVGAVIGVDNADSHTLNSPLGNAKSWHYIVGSKSRDEMAMTVDITECAKYTTTIHITVQPRADKSLSNKLYEKHRSNKIQNKNASVKSLLKSDEALRDSLKTYSLDVRLYHDAAVAEVVGWKGRRYFKARNEYPNRNMDQCDEKAQLNQFLGELLEFCLVQGRVMHDIVMVE